MNRTSVIIVLSLVLLCDLQECELILGNDDTCNYCSLLETVKTQMNQLQNKLDELSNTSTPCSEIKRLLPHSPSDYYSVQFEGEYHTVYCNMSKLCGDNGGWMRVGHLNMTNKTEACPTGFKTYDDVEGKRSCGRLSVPPYCLSVNFTTYGVNYTQVCGRVTGYQKGSTDAFEEFGSAKQRNTAELAYVDGVSITRGSNPRKHIWTYIASNKEDKKWCPCDVSNASSIPSFVGEDYFCETALKSGQPEDGMLYTDDLLWDGEQCGTIQTACCKASWNMPWFKKVLDAPSTDYIELRVCGDEPPLNEDVGVNYYEIYVK